MDEMDEMGIKAKIGMELTKIGKEYSKFLGNEEVLKTFLEYTVIMTFNFFEDVEKAEEFLVKNSINPIQFMRKKI